ncbi:MAG: ChbG/HpnK family deacetylase [Thermodesulfobacteriota bacterium]
MPRLPAGRKKPAAPSRPRAELTVCADDYGLAPGIGQAIRDLAARGRVTAVSCCTLGPRWPSEGRLIRELAAEADIGLHLTLTDHQPLGPMPGLAPQGRLPSLTKLMALAYSGRLDTHEISDEIERQTDRFEASFGAPPIFLDGHHHVHQLPVIREAVLSIFVRRLIRPGAWLRYLAEPWSRIRRHAASIGRAWLLSLLGRVLARWGRVLNISGNEGFRGVRSFRERSPYHLLFKRFLTAPFPRTLIMCHPGLVDEDLIKLDWVTRTREEEYAFLAGAEYPGLLAESGWSLVRMSTLPSPLP